MPQVTDWSTDNAAGGAFRAQLNQILEAVQSCSSGVTAPSPTVAGMPWFDISTNPGVLKVRDQTNSFWIPLLTETVPPNSLQGNPTGAAAPAQSLTMAQLRTMLGVSALIADAGWEKRTSGLWEQRGSSTGTTNGAGVLTITYPIAFPTASRRPIVCVGDNVLGVDVRVVHASVSVTGFQVATSLASALVRINWSVWGN